MEEFYTSQYDFRISAIDRSLTKGIYTVSDRCVRARVSPKASSVDWRPQDDGWDMLTYGCRVGLGISQDLANESDTWIITLSRAHDEDIERQQEAVRYQEALARKKTSRLLKNRSLRPLGIPSPRYKTKVRDCTTYTAVAY